MKARSILTALLLAAGGCATHPKVDPNINWNSRIGSYTYEQALAELGRPDAVVESSAGKAADWILKRGSQMSFGLGVGHSVFGPHVGTGVGVGTSVSPPPHGQYLHLAFDPEGKLTSWQKVQH